MSAVAPVRASVLDENDVPHVLPSHVPTPTPSDIVERGDTLVSVMVTVPVAETAKACTEVPLGAIVSVKVSVVGVVALGAAGVEVLLQPAAAMTATATNTGSANDPKI